MMWGYGGQEVDANGKVAINSPATIAAVSDMVQAFNDGYDDTGPCPGRQLKQPRLPGRDDLVNPERLEHLVRGAERQDPVLRGHRPGSVPAEGPILAAGAYRSTSSRPTAKNVDAAKAAAQVADAARRLYAEIPLQPELHRRRQRSLHVPSRCPGSNFRGRQGVPRSRPVCASGWVPGPANEKPGWPGRSTWSSTCSRGRFRVSWRSRRSPGPSRS